MRRPGVGGAGRRRGSPGAGAGAASDARRPRISAIRLIDPVIISHPEILPQIFERSELIAFIKKGELSDKGIMFDNYHDFVFQDQFTEAVLTFLKSKSEMGPDEVLIRQLSDIDTYQDPVLYVELKGEAVFARRDGYLYSLETLGGLAFSPFTRVPFRYPGYEPIPSWGLLKHPLYEGIKAALPEKGSTGITKRQLMGLIQAALRTPCELFDLAGVKVGNVAKLESDPRIKRTAIANTVIHTASMAAASYVSVSNPYMAVPVLIMYGCLLYPVKQLICVESYVAASKVDTHPNTFFQVVLISFIFPYSGYLSDPYHAVNAEIVMRVLFIIHYITDIIPLSVFSVENIYQVMRTLTAADFTRLSPGKQRLSKLFFCLVTLSFASVSYEMRNNVFLDRTGTMAIFRSVAPAQYVAYNLLLPILAMLTINILPAMGFLAKVNQDLQAPKITRELLLSWGPKIAITGMMAYLQSSAGASASETANHAFLTFISLFADAAVHRVLRFNPLKPVPAATDLFRVALPVQEDASAAAPAASAAAGAVPS